MTELLNCATCKKQLPTESFHKNSRAKRGYAFTCTPCASKKNATRRKLPANSSYENVKIRCNVPSARGYANYGGRGISYDPIIFKTYKTFWAAVEHLYQEGLEAFPGESLTVDRINNDGDYVLDNIRFIPLWLNCNNKRNSRMITWKGKTQSMSMWAKEFKLPRHIVRSRLENNWNMDLIKNTPNDANLVKSINKMMKGSK